MRAWAAAQTIFHKGELSRELMFLLAGELHVKSALFPQRTVSIVTVDTETTLSTEGEPLFTKPHGRSFGESVIVGMRRPETYVAASFTETLQLSRDALCQIFARNQRHGLRIVATLLRSAGQRQRLSSLAARFFISSLPLDSEKRAAFIIQQLWQRALLRINAPESPAGMLQRDAPPPPSVVLKNKMLELMRREIDGILQDVRHECRAGTLASPTDADATRRSRDLDAKPPTSKPSRSSTRGSLVYETFMEEGMRARASRGESAAAWRDITGVDQSAILPAERRASAIERVSLGTRTVSTVDV